MIEIKEYDNKYAYEISKIIIQNLLEVNSKDYGLEFVKKSAKEFTPDKIKRNFSRIIWYSDDGEYWILTVFVDIAHHKQGIGKLLISEIEKFAFTISAKKLVIPASITGCEFYHKLGYEYANGQKKLNENQMYIMEKFL